MAVGLISLDPEKAFDCADDNYLFNAMKSFGFGNNFLSCGAAIVHWSYMYN